ncbi:hypothetical protein DXG01_009744 [Tephrocybe rancida]|nr:hypothetical protein DXG01_009744 [Tephrocybe rancida]
MGAFVRVAHSWNNGVQKTPAMGFNTWNRFACNINETLIRDTAAQMDQLGFLAAGYTFVNIDDCWNTKSRDSLGKLVVDSKKFPTWALRQEYVFITRPGSSGSRVHQDLCISAISSTQASTNTFPIDAQEDQGLTTCAGFSGSLDHELTDARTFVEWGFDYIKVFQFLDPFGWQVIPPQIDNCDSGSFQGTNAQRFKRWTDALNQVQEESGKMLFYSLVEWQSFDAWTWAPPIANSWRMYDDIQPNWSRITQILNNASFIGDYTTFYAHNDLDMLENGNGALTLEEQRSHFTAWAFAKSPLLIGTDFSQLSEDSIAILTNPEIIAVNQDIAIGEPLKPFFWGKNPDGTWDPSFPAQYWR